MHRYDKYTNRRFVDKSPYTVMYRPTNKAIEDGSTIIAAKVVADFLNERSSRLLNEPSKNYYVVDNSSGKEVAVDKELENE